MSEIDRDRGRHPGVLVRQDRARVLTLELIERRAPVIKATVAKQIADEFGVSIRTGYFDFEAVWQEIRRTHAAEIEQLQATIIAKLGDYLIELYDLYTEARIEGDRRIALDTLKEIAKARELLAPEPSTAAADVNVLVNVLQMTPLAREQRIAELRARLSPPQQQTGVGDCVDDCVDDSALS